MAQPRVFARDRSVSLMVPTDQAYRAIGLGKPGKQVAQLDERLNAANVENCKKELGLIMSGRSGFDLEKSWEKILILKNRPLAQCTFLHFAVAESIETGDTEIISKLLEKRAKLDAKASYTTSKEDVTVEAELEAIHVAACLGSVPALEILLKEWQRQKGQGSDAESEGSKSETECQEGCAEFLMSPATIREVKKDAKKIQFYYPIHDAAYMGRKDALIWLLDNKAKATATNKDGCTPLHFVALIGGRGLLREEKDVKDVVEALLNHRADLEARSNDRTTPYPCEKDLQKKIPLEIAADTQFPKQLLCMLAPSQSVEASGDGKDFSRLFADIFLLASRNMKVAEDFARQVKEKALKPPQKPEEFEFRLRIWREAQRPGQVDQLARLLYMVPMAAADMLDILTVEPEVQDPAKHPIPSRTFLRNGPMRCTYRPDSTSVDGVKWPRWTYDASKHELGGWHQDFVPKNELKGRDDDLYDSDVKVLLLPNVLDVDIFMALTRTWETNLKIFARLPVQGIIYCLWDNLVWRVFAWSWILSGIELVVLIYWGLLAKTSDGNAESTGWRNSPEYAPKCWCVLLAGFLRETFDLVWWFLAHWSKFSEHQREKREDYEVMMSLWEPWVFCTDSWFLSTFGFLAVRLVFLFSTSSFSSSRMSHFNQFLLAGNAFMQGFRMTYMLRLLHRFKRIIAIFKTFFSRAIGEMLLIALMIFMSFSLAFQTLIRNRGTLWTLTYLYRGLMFGDGDGLDKMGLTPAYQEEGENNHSNVTLLVDSGASPPDSSNALLVFMFFATILFNITIINLIIAIYGNEYDEVECVTDLYFHKERAKYCLIFVQMLHKQRVLEMLQALGSLGPMLGALTNALLTVPRSAREAAQSLKPWQRTLALWSRVRTGGLPEFLLALGAFGVLLVLLWSFRSLVAVAPIVFAVLLAIFQIWVQVEAIQCDWFQPDAPELGPGIQVKVKNKRNHVLRDQKGVIVKRAAKAGVWTLQLHSPEGQVDENDVAEDDLDFLQEPSFLWICHRADYDENYFYRSGEVTQRDVEVTNEMMRGLSDRLQERLQDADARLAGGLEQQGERLKDLELLIQQLSDRLDQRETALCNGVTALLERGIRQFEGERLASAGIQSHGLQSERDFLASAGVQSYELQSSEPGD